MLFKKNLLSFKKTSRFKQKQIALNTICNKKNVKKITIKKITQKFFAICFCLTLFLIITKFMALNKYV